jgi:hypothetical protein
MGVLKVKVSFDFVGFDVAKKLTFGETVSAKLILGPAVTKFPHLTVSAADLVIANDNLRTANQNFIDNPALESELHDAEVDWISAFSQDANYVSSLCKGVASDIDLSGYNKTKDTRTNAVKPQVTVVKSGKSLVTGGLNFDILKQSDATQFLSVLFTKDVTVTYSGNQVTFTKVNDDGTTTQAAVCVAKKRKSNFVTLKSKSDMKSQTIAINAAGASDPSAASDNGIL